MTEQISRRVTSLLLKLNFNIIPYINQKPMAKSNKNYTNSKSEIWS